MKLFKFLPLLLPLTIIPVSVSCNQTSDTNAKPKLYKKDNVEKISTYLTENNLSFSSAQKQALDNITTSSLQELKEKLKSIKDALINAKNNNQTDVITQNETKLKDLMTQNALVFLAYPTHFKHIFFDYALLTDNTDPTKPVHSPRYRHFALGETNSFNDQPNAHKHNNYNKNESAFKNLQDISFISQLRESNQYRGYKVFYVTIYNAVFTFLVKDNNLTLQPFLITFTKAKPNVSIDGDELYHFMDKDKNTLENADIQQFEDRFITPEKGYPSYSILF
ncbi:hypothetical protein [Mycoplasma nasistruthionis]|uniref:Lipoprotein n=1 Tax=Mycoplasma nasistruthionis TaxID=353852 RepID=A0A4Y6I5L5_9MOLU|nr:hypothetical protein [Mycoplasma nasistruthionis]QDF64813.1 hypothetical protein FIV53_00590 [Mycoplasma nasistruthionis]